MYIVVKHSFGSPLPAFLSQPPNLRGNVFVVPETKDIVVIDVLQ